MKKKSQMKTGNMHPRLPLATARDGDIGRDVRENCEYFAAATSVCLSVSLSVCIGTRQNHFTGKTFQAISCMHSQYVAQLAERRGEACFVFD